MPSIVTVPASGSRNPVAIRNSVVLPAPLRPTSSTASPAATVSVTPASARREPNAFAMPSSTSTAKAWQSADVEAIVMLLGAFGATGALWAWQNRGRHREETERKKQLATMLDESMQVAFHLAKHAATSRNQPLGNIHVLYAIVQDERVAAALRDVGGDYDAIEAAIDRAMD